jgi:hypothetical protein
LQQSAVIRVTAELPLELDAEVQILFLVLLFIWVLSVAGVVWLFRHAARM